MRDFTPEEKDKLINTPITMKCFDGKDFHNIEDVYYNYNLHNYWTELCEVLEGLRNKYNETKDDSCFIELVRLLPNSYKVINLAKTPDLEKITNGMIQRTI